MVRDTDHNLQLYYDQLHWVDGVDHYAEQAIFPGGTGRNRAYYKQYVDMPEDRANDEKITGRLYDPQTSGGLLMAVNADDADDLLHELQNQTIDARIVGDVASGTGRVNVIF